MGADGNLLQGEVTENPAAEDKDVEQLLLRFLESLVEEQRAGLAARQPEARAGS